MDVVVKPPPPIPASCDNDDNDNRSDKAKVRREIDKTHERTNMQQSAHRIPNGRGVMSSTHESRKNEGLQIRRETTKQNTESCKYESRMIGSFSPQHVT